MIKLDVRGFSIKYGTQKAKSRNLKLEALERKYQALLNQLETVEIFQSMCQLKANKCPGLDGLPVEWYRKTWDTIGTTVNQMLLKSIEDKTLPSSSRMEALSLLDKPGRNPLLLGNWRPLTLLNVDYKIYAKTLANRIQSVSPQIIHSSQTGLMKGHYIAEYIVELISLIRYCEENDEQALLVSMDFEKAFDKVEWNALFKVMELFNFGPKFIQMTKLTYTDIESCVMNNGNISNRFKVTRSVRQGCPYSPNSRNYWY